MSDQYKVKMLKDGPFVATRPSLGLLAGGAPVVRSTLHTVARSADSVVTSGRRTVSLAHSWAAPSAALATDTDPDAGTHDYPYSGTWRVAWETLGHAAPGAAHEVFAIAYHSGPTEVDPGDTLADVTGGLALGVSYVEDDLVTVAASNASAGGQPSALAYGALPASGAPRSLRQQWGRTEPFGPTVAKGTQSNLSESPQIQATLYWVDGSRAMSACVVERPWKYTRAHDADWSDASIHCYTQPSWPDTLAREAYPDSALTYEEPRYSTQRMRTVAERQADVLGPVIFSHSWHKTNTDPDQTSISGQQVASGSSGFVSLHDGTSSTWTATEPGLPASAHLALPQVVSSHEATHGGAFAVVPVRVTVTYSAGSTATLRVMTSPRSFVDVTLTGGSDHATACGYLEVQRSAEDWDPATGAPVAQIFVDTGASTATIKTVMCTYGHLPYSTSAIIVAG